MIRLTAVQAEAARRRFNDDKWQVVTNGDGGECHIWTAGRYTSGIPAFAMGPGRSVTAARACWLIEHGELDEELLVFSTCGNTDCVKLEHLVQGTRKDMLNIRGKQAYKLPTWDDVRRIRQLRAEDKKRWTTRALSELTGISTVSIHRIINNLAWVE